MQKMREVIALAVLAICACTDYREKSIYVLPVLTGGIAGVVLSVTDIILSADAGGRPVILGYMILPAALGAVMIFYSVVSGSAIGIGDGLLCGSLGFIIGIRACLFSMTAAALISGIFAVYILISKRDGSRRIPWVPFLLAGYIVNLKGVLP